MIYHDRAPLEANVPQRSIPNNHTKYRFFRSSIEETDVGHAVDNEVFPYHKKGLVVPNERTVQPVWFGETAFESDMFDFVTRMYTIYSYKGHATGERAVKTYLYIIDGELCLTIRHAPETDQAMSLRLLHYLTTTPASRPS